jgi:hypothetical protein
VRSLAFCLLVVFVSDIAVALHQCVEQTHGCGDLCARCFCKRDADKTRIRTVCPCCRPQADFGTPVTTLDPAVLPAAVVPLPAPPVTRAAPDRAVSAFSYAPAIPHPPPRLAAFA